MHTHPLNQKVAEPGGEWGEGTAIYALNVPP